MAPSASADGSATKPHLHAAREGGRRIDSRSIYWPGPRLRCDPELGTAPAAASVLDQRAAANQTARPWTLPVAHALPSLIRGSVA